MATSNEAMDRLDTLTPEQLRLALYWLADAYPDSAMTACEYAEGRTS